MSEELNKEFDEMLDDVMGGILDVEDHSPDAEDSEEKSLEAEEAPDADETFEPYGEEEEPADDSAEEDGKKEEAPGTPEKTDSVPEQEAPDPDEEKTALQKEIDNYKKRLHDTQNAMHRANEEKAELQKELDELKKQKTSGENDDENWFKDEDGVDEKSADLESKIEAIEDKQEQFQREQAFNQWKMEADKFASTHEDFNDLVYEKLEPLLNEVTGDPAVLANYMKWQDKSPAGAYEFAKRYFGIEEKLHAKSGVPVQEEKEVKPEIDPTKGKAGLDRLNSAEFAEPKRVHSNMIDEVFG